jgi:hypothetical protein
MLPGIEVALQSPRPRTACAKFLHNSKPLCDLAQAARWCAQADPAHGQEFQQLRELFGNGVKRAFTK